MPEIFAYTITRADSDDRIQLLLNTLVQARATAGVDFYWLVVTNGSTRAADLCRKSGVVTEILEYSVNCGQHVATNDALRRARMFNDTKYLLRLDDDVQFTSKKWLKTLVNASAALDDKMILSPRVRGLNNPPARSTTNHVRGYKLEFLLDAIGGICRLMPLHLLDDYVADVRSPMGLGDAAGIGEFCINNVIPMAYLCDVRVKHAKTTAKQVKDDPQHFSLHSLLQIMPYIPARVGND